MLSMMPSLLALTRSHACSAYICTMHMCACLRKCVKIIQLPEWRCNIEIVSHPSNMSKDTNTIIVSYMFRHRLHMIGLLSLLVTPAAMHAQGRVKQSVPPVSLSVIRSLALSKEHVDEKSHTSFLFVCLRVCIRLYSQPFKLYHVNSYSLYYVVTFSLHPLG